MNRRLALMLALVAGGALALFSLSEARDAPAPHASDPLAPVAAVAPEPAPELHSRPVAAESSRRAPIAAVDPSPPMHDPADATVQGDRRVRVISGRVLDAEALPVADVPVGPIHGDTEVRTDSDGRFTIELTSRRGEIVAKSAAWVTTDSEGLFLLAGLLDRDYRVKAFDPETLLATTSRPIPAGTLDARVTMPKDALHATLSGRIVGPRGRPCRNATLHLEHRAFETTARVFGGTLTFAALQGRDSATTDEDGRFTFTNVPKSGVRLTVMGDDVVPKTRDLDPGIDPTNVEIEVDVRHHFKLELDDPTDRVDGIRARSAAGAPVEIWQIGAKNRDAYATAPIEGGRSPVLSISARATELLLVKQNIVVGSIPLILTSGNVTVLRY